MSPCPVTSKLCNKLLRHGQGDPIVEKLRHKLILRSIEGLNKYGVTLARDDLTSEQWITHAQEEALDLANYLQVLIQRHDAVTALHDMQEQALAAAAVLEAMLETLKG